MATFSTVKKKRDEERIHHAHEVNRREFLKYTALASGSLYLGLGPSLS